MALDVVDVADLVSRDGIAERIGVTRSQVYDYTLREGFPEPITHLGRQRVYLWSEVSAWHTNYQATKSKGGRPRVRTERTRAEAQNPCPVKDCGNTRKRDARGVLLTFCRKHMEMFVWL